jgi:hypothetical protein
MIKTLVISPILTRSGYGEHGRFIVDSLASRPDVFDLYLHPIHWGDSSWICDDDPKTKMYNNLCIKKETFKGEYDLVVQVTVPNEWPQYSEIFKSKCNIGITAGAETETIPVQWIEPANKMDHIIFTSKHAENGFKKTEFSQKAIGSEDLISTTGISTSSDVVGYPVKNITPSDLSSKLNLDTEFNFLTITQLAPRKNAVSLIQEFVEEFRHENVGLVCKMHHMNNSNLDQHMLYNSLFRNIENDSDRRCKVYWIHGAMNENDLHGLYTHPDIHAYVSATHGEGFGLPFYESAYRGLPVVATGWSGHLDFLRMPKLKGKNSTEMYEKIKYEIKEVAQDALMDNIIMPGMKWAYPRENAVRKALRNTYQAYTAKKNIAGVLQEYILNTFSEENQFNKICDICESVYTEKTEWSSSSQEVVSF